MERRFLNEEVLLVRNFVGFFTCLRKFKGVIDGVDQVLGRFAFFFFIFLRNFNFFEISQSLIVELFLVAIFDVYSLFFLLFDFLEITIDLIKRNLILLPVFDIVLKFFCNFILSVIAPYRSFLHQGMIDDI